MMAVRDKVQKFVSVTLPDIWKPQDHFYSVLSYGIQNMHFKPKQVFFVSKPKQITSTAMLQHAIENVNKTFK